MATAPIGTGEQYVDFGTVTAASPIVGKAREGFGRASAHAEVHSFCTWRRGQNRPACAALVIRSRLSRIVTTNVFALDPRGDFALGEELASFSRHAMRVCRKGVNGSRSLGVNCNVAAKPLGLARGAWSPPPWRDQVPRYFAKAVTDKANGPLTGVPRTR